MMIGGKKHSMKKRGGSLENPNVMDVLALVGAVDILQRVTSTKTGGKRRKSRSRRHRRKSSKRSKKSRKH